MRLHRSFLLLPFALLSSPLLPQDLSQTAQTGTGPASSVEAEKVAMPEVTVSGKSDNTRLDDTVEQQLQPKLGASSFAMDQAALQALPQGDNTPLDKVLLQAPGVSYDSAISNPDFHVRNEYANVQYRLDGILLPDGVSALGAVLETGLVRSLTLLDGALPAQFGLRTAGVVDIRTKTGAQPGGSLNLYAGSWQTFSPSLDFGGQLGPTRYFVAGRWLQSAQGLENAMPTPDPVHDATTQQKLFAYGSTLLGPSTRLVAMAGDFQGDFQIPDVTGQTPLGDYGPASLPSSQLNDRESDRFAFGLLALQTHQDRLDTQSAVSVRDASAVFTPDVQGDLAFNDVASAVSRRSRLYGLQWDCADRLGSAHTLRAGFTAGVEDTVVVERVSVLPLDAQGNALPDPVSIDDAGSLQGWTAGGYVQDEWRLRQDLGLNAGLRYDRMAQFTDADQWSPRIAAEWRPAEGTVVHAGGARSFTPPMQAQATPWHPALFQGTTQQAQIPLNDPVEPERAWTCDLGLDQAFPAGLSAGLDVYDKESADTLDDGQFGQTVALEQFNYADGSSRGLELKAALNRGALRLYGNAGWARTVVEDVVSNEAVIGDPVEFNYLKDHAGSASDAQACSASWGASWRLGRLFAGVDGIYGSGLAAGFANQQHAPAYAQWNAALALTLEPWTARSPLTLRLSAINLLDTSYVLREAGGVGEFAPQYGPRRGLFTELTQRF